MSWNFLKHLIAVTGETESPTEYWRWAGIACLAATLRNNCWIISQAGIVYPNIYVVLFADSGLTRKGYPCKYVGSLIRRTNNTKFLGGRASIQGIIKELSQSYTNTEGTMVSGASGLMYSEELSSFLVDDPVAIPLLIDLYDYHEVWESKLITSHWKLKEVCLSLLCASNSNLFKSVYTERAINGGLLGRTFIIKEERARHRKSLIDFGKMELNGQIDPDRLWKHLVKISKLRGELRLTDAAKDEYNSWYYAIPDSVFSDRIGFGSRLGTHVLKLAIALAAARDDFALVLDKDDIVEAITLCQAIRNNYKGLIVGVGTAATSHQASLIVKHLILSPSYHASRKNLIQKLFGDVEMNDMDAILQMLIHGGLVVERSINNEPGFKLTDDGVRKLVEGE